MIVKIDQLPKKNIDEAFDELTEHNKETLNSDGHQFHQYQQNQQSPYILTR
jgi:hypothetical protein